MLVGVLFRIGNGEQRSSEDRLTSLPPIKSGPTTIYAQKMFIDKKNPNYTKFEIPTAVQGQLAERVLPVPPLHTGQYHEFVILLRTELI